MSEDSRVQTHKALPWHVGALKNGHFPFTQSVLLLGRPGGPIALSPSPPYSLEKNAGDCLRGTFSPKPLGPRWRGAAGRAQPAAAQALSKQDDVVITC